MESMLPGAIGTLFFFRQWEIVHQSVRWIIDIRTIDKSWEISKHQLCDRIGLPRTMARLA